MLGSRSWEVQGLELRPEFTFLLILYPKCTYCVTGIVTGARVHIEA